MIKVSDQLDSKSRSHWNDIKMFKLGWVKFDNRTRGALTDQQYVITVSIYIFPLTLFFF